MTKEEELRILAQQQENARLVSTYDGEVSESWISNTAETFQSYSLRKKAAEEAASAEEEEEAKENAVREEDAIRYALNRSMMSSRSWEENERRSKEYKKETDERNSSVGLGVFFLVGGIFLGLAIFSFSPLLAMIFIIGGIVAAIPLLFQ